MGRKSEREEFLGDRGLDMRGNKGHHILKKNQQNNMERKLWKGRQKAREAG